MHMKIYQNFSVFLIKGLNDQKCCYVLLCEWQIFENYYELYLKCTLNFCLSISPVSFYNTRFLIHRVNLCCIHCFFLNYIISFTGCFIYWIWCCVWIGGFDFPIWATCKYTKQNEIITWKDDIKFEFLTFLLKK